MHPRATPLRASFRSVAALLLVTGLLAPLATAGWWDDLDKGEAVRLSDVFADPTRFEGRSLTFFCVLFGRDEVYFPLHTPFTEARYDNLSLWPDGAPLWEEAAYKKALSTFYVEKKNPARDELLRLETLTRIEVTARIRTIWRGTPYLEVLSWRRTGWRLGEESVREVMRGDNYAKKGELDLALGAYRRALKPDLAPVYAVLVRGRVASVLRQLGREAEALAFERGETAPPAPDAAPPPPSATAPPALGPVTEDLPGAPVEAPSATTPTADLPGTPVEAPSAPPTAVAPGAPPAGAATPAEPPIRAPVPRIPPRRTPRLEGVK